MVYRAEVWLERGGVTIKINEYDSYDAGRLLTVGNLGCRYSRLLSAGRPFILRGGDSRSRAESERLKADFTKSCSVIDHPSENPCVGGSIPSLAINVASSETPQSPCDCGRALLRSSEGRYEPIGNDMRGSSLEARAGRELIPGLLLALNQKSSSAPK